MRQSFVSKTALKSSFIKAKSIRGVSRKGLPDKDPMNILLIHGKKPQKHNPMHVAFEECLKLALKLSKGNDYNLILISGGQTRSNQPSEASIGHAYLKNKTTIPIILERNSKTTIENILFSKNILQLYNISHIDAIISGKLLLRYKYLYKKLWPEVYDKADFIGAPVSYPLLYYLIESIYYLYSLVDIKERWLPKITKRLFRNN